MDQRVKKLDKKRAKFDPDAADRKKRNKAKALKEKEAHERKLEARAILDEQA